MTLVEVLVATGILAGVALGIGSVLSYSSQFTVKSNRRISFLALRTNILAHLTRDDAWVNTSNDTQNTSGPFKCLFLGTGCPAVGGPFKILSAGNTVVYDPINQPASGFTDDGGPCIGYPSAQCPVKMNLSWTGVCVGCDPAQIQVDVSFTPSSYSKSFQPGALDRYSFSLVKNIDVSLTLTISGNVANYNIYTMAGAPVAVRTVYVNITSGSVVYSTSPSTPALTTGSFPTGSKLTITNNGTIVGAGGVGGGGAECSYVWNSSAGAGGGGAGFGQGGNANGCGATLGRYGHNGQPGSATSGGSGGGPGNMYTCFGGSGGAPGMAGGSGGSCNAGGGSGGAGGPAIVGASNIAWVGGSGTIWGAVQ